MSVITMSKKNWFVSLYTVIIHWVILWSSVLTDHTWANLINMCYFHISAQYCGNILTNVFDKLFLWPWSSLTSLFFSPSLPITQLQTTATSHKTQTCASTKWFMAGCCLSWCYLPSSNASPTLGSPWMPPANSTTPCSRRYCWTTADPQPISM